MNALNNETALTSQACKEYPKGSKAMIIPSIEGLMDAIPGWNVAISYMNIDKTFKFKNYHQTTAFVNAVTWLAHKDDHHPDICFGYNRCTIKLTTHTCKGLSKNDFILAAKINALLD